ncbi:hypothetical protein RF11_14483 [Thelohanellus kitauei]|uniref:Uncharacterized protein n=1 Tax=Thelohanellus kitauei TaxID=669202 RepID=A0A0C2N5T5_THEKT|nr:hypothetical protein RF11_14483 [Thelohanellus kitauei]
MLFPSLAWSEISQKTIQYNWRNAGYASQNLQMLESMTKPIEYTTSMATVVAWLGFYDDLAKDEFLENLITVDEILLKTEFGSKLLECKKEYYGISDGLADENGLKIIQKLKY